MKKINLLTNPNNYKEAVFVALTAKHQLYKDVSFATEKFKNKEIELCLLMNRWDGCIGFPGGFVENNETLEQGLIREVQEELNWNINNYPLTPISTYEFKTLKGLDIVSHFYTVETTFEDLLEILKNACTAEHFIIENTGAFIAHLEDYELGKGYKNLLQSGLIANAKVQLIDLLVKKEIISLDEAHTYTEWSIK